MNSPNRRSLIATAVLAALSYSGNALATNGMNMEAYGARAGGMGGAGMAYDSGNSAVMNNPATLSLMPDGVDRLGLGLTILGPDVESSFGGALSSKSDGTAYYMPSVSYMRKRGPFSYGAAVFAQGGMGTEYGKGAPLFSGGYSFPGNAMVPLSGEEIRSEVGVGRLMFPVVYQANDRLSVAGELDVVWASMDLQMDLSGAQFGDLVSTHQFGEASGSMVTGLSNMIGSGSVQDVNWARFDFSNDNDFTGEAFGAGLGAKLGLLYRVNDRFSIGATYHSKTHISDLETNDATLSFNADFDDGSGGTATQTVPVTGKVEVKDFQWPATYAIGAAFKVNDRLMLVADVKRINWSDAMKNFTMTFTADNAASNGSFAGAELTSTLYQDWDDQTVFSFGGEYQVTPRFTVRLGMNIADNPVPDAYMNPLFPAIVERHYTAGFGYVLSKASKIGFALAYAPEVKQTADSGVTSTHSQLNWRLNYVHTFH